MRISKRQHLLIFLQLIIVCSLGDTGTTLKAETLTNSFEASSATNKSSLSSPTIITARTPEELLYAIGSDREIHLTEREYILSDLNDRHMDFVRWDPTTAGNSMTIRNVRNLKLLGASKEPVRLIVRPYSVFVLNFEACSNIVLENLVMGHAPQKGECESGVIGATNCTNLSFERCDLFGCGTEGLTLKAVSGLSFRESTIRDCSYGILTAESCRNLSFEKSQFLRNKEFWGMQLHDSRDVLFSDCIIQENKSTDPLFQVVSCSNVRVRGGTISKNDVTMISNNEKTIAFEGVEGVTKKGASR